MLQGADVVVAQGVEDVLELAAAGSDDADVAAPAGPDPVPDDPHGGAHVSIEPGRETEGA